MTETHSSTSRYQLGDPIALEDLLALPYDDGQRYARDEEGRLSLMSPERFDSHRLPLAHLQRILMAQSDPPVWVLPEPSIPFERIYDLSGNLLPKSDLGPKALEPDLAVYGERPGQRDADRPGGLTFCSPDGLGIVIEILSPATWNNDLGLGAAQQVDRWRSYLASGVPEYWVINAGPEQCPLPARSGLFLSNHGDRWTALDGDDLVLADEEVDGLRAVRRGKIRSAALPVLELDLQALWDELAG